MVLEPCRHYHSYNNTLSDAVYPPVSPEFGEDLLCDLVTCDVSSYINSVFALSREWSTTSALVGAGTTEHKPPFNRQLPEHTCRHPI